MQEAPWSAGRRHFWLKRMKWGVKGGVEDPVRKPHSLWMSVVYFTVRSSSSLLSLRGKHSHRPAERGRGNKDR